MTTGAKYAGCYCSHTEEQRGVGVGVSGGDKAAKQQQLQSGSHNGLQSMSAVLGKDLWLVQLLKTPNS